MYFFCVITDDLKQNKVNRFVALRVIEQTALMDEYPAKYANIRGKYVILYVAKPVLYQVVR